MENEGHKVTSRMYFPSLVKLFGEKNKHLYHDLFRVIDFLATLTVNEVAFVATVAATATSMHTCAAIATMRSSY